MQDQNELVFELKGKKPDQMSIDRLAAYMKEFAILLGERNHPLYSAVRSGSVCIAATLPETGGLSSARNRVFQSSKGLGPKDAQAAFEKLANMAILDGTPARVTAKSGTVAHLPRRHNRPQRLTVHESGFVTGRMTGMVDEKTGGAKARIRPIDGGPLVFATATGGLADGLGAFFRKFVRVYGLGEWIRDDEGRWVCAGIEISDIHIVQNVNLMDAITSIREIGVEWSNEDPFDEFESDANRA